MEKDFIPNIFEEKIKEVLDRSLVSSYILLQDWIKEYNKLSNKNWLRKKRLKDMIFNAILDIYRNNHNEK